MKEDVSGTKIPPKHREDESLTDPPVLQTDRQTDRRTDGRAIASRYSIMLLRAKTPPPASVIRLLDALVGIFVPETSSFISLYRLTSRAGKWLRKQNETKKPQKSKI